MKKTLSVILLCAVLISAFASCTGGTDISEDSNMDTSLHTSGEESSSTLEKAPFRTAVSSHCAYTVARGNLTADENHTKLTDGEFETVGLNVDRCTSAAGSALDIVIDLGARVEDMTSFEAHYMVGSVAGSEPSTFAVQISDDNENFTDVGSVKPTLQPDRAVGHIDYAVVTAENGVSGRYVKYSMQIKAGKKLCLQELIAFTGTTEPQEDRTLEYEKVPETPLKNVVLPTWTFDTTMPNYGATDKEYDTYFTYLQNAGFEGIIILSNGGYDGNIDKAVLQKILDYCKKYNMKIFAGVTSSQHNFDAMCENHAYAETYIKSMQKVMDNIYYAFGKTYREQLYGWYFNMELNNVVYKKNADLCAELVNAVIEKANAIDDKMPLLMSPYTAGWGGGAAQLKIDLTNFLSKTNFRPFDIYCPQDSVGAGLINIEDSAGYFKVMKECCDEKGIVLWANVEDFVVNSHVPGYKADTLPAPLSRFVKQIGYIKKYISGCTTFTFQAYTPEDVFNYTIHNEVTYYYNEFLKYANTGKAPKETQPEILEVTQSEPVDGYITVNVVMNIPTYHIDIVCADYDGVSHSFGSWYLTEADGKTYLSFRDYVGDTGDKGRIYAFKAYDHSSDASGVAMLGYNCDMTSLFSGPVDRTKEGKIVSIGATYTASTPPQHSNKDDGMELTDGIFGSSSSFGDAPWQGYNQAVTFVMDLGEIKENVGDIVISMLAGGTGAIYEPQTISVKGSMDGATYYNFGTFNGVMENKDTLFTVKRTIELKNAASCRFIQIDVEPVGWFFVDEIDVVAYD